MIPDINSSFGKIFDSFGLPSVKRSKIELMASRSFGRIEEEKTDKPVKVGAFKSLKDFIKKYAQKISDFVKKLLGLNKSKKNPNDKDPGDKNSGDIPTAPPPPPSGKTAGNAPPAPPQPGTVPPAPGTIPNPPTPPVNNPRPPANPNLTPPVPKGPTGKKAPNLPAQEDLLSELNKNEKFRGRSLSSSNLASQIKKGADEDLTKRPTTPTPNLASKSEILPKKSEDGKTPPTGSSIPVSQASTVTQTPSQPTDDKTPAPQPTNQRERGSVKDLVKNLKRKIEEEKGATPGNTSQETFQDPKQTPTPTQSETIADKLPASPSSDQTESGSVKVSVKELTKKIEEEKGSTAGTTPQETLQDPKQTPAPTQSETITDKSPVPPYSGQEQNGGVRVTVKDLQEPIEREEKKGPSPSESPISANNTISEKAKEATITASESEAKRDSKISLKGFTTKLQGLVKEPKEKKVAPPVPSRENRPSNAAASKETETIDQGGDSAEKKSQQQNGTVVTPPSDDPSATTRPKQTTLKKVEIFEQKGRETNPKSSPQRKHSTVNVTQQVGKLQNPAAVQNPAGNQGAGTPEKKKDLAASWQAAVQQPKTPPGKQDESPKRAAAGLSPIFKNDLSLKIGKGSPFGKKTPESGNTPEGGKTPQSKDDSEGGRSTVAINLFPSEEPGFEEAEKALLEEIKNEEKSKQSLLPEDNRKQWKTMFAGRIGGRAKSIKRRPTQKTLKQKREERATLQKQEEAEKNLSKGMADTEQEIPSGEADTSSKPEVVHVENHVNGVVSADQAT